MRWALCVLGILLGCASAASGQVVCTWTDNPIVSGETPIKAAHINEIRACIDQILGSIGTPEPPEPPEPPGSEGHIVVSDLRQWPPSAGANWLYFYVTARSAIQDLTLDVRFERPGEPFARCTERLSGLVAGQRRELYFLPGVCGSTQPWATVRIATPETFTCEGCGAYSAADIPIITERPAAPR